MVLVAYILSANAQTWVLEEADVISNRPASYSDTFVVATYVPYPLPEEPKIESWIYPALPVILPGDEVGSIGRGQCVNYARALSGQYLSGNANEWLTYVNSWKPSLKAVVVLDKGKFGHLGVVFYIDWENKRFKYVSRNELGLWIINETEMNFDDPRILGFVK